MQECKDKKQKKSARTKRARHFQPSPEAQSGARSKGNTLNAADAPSWGGGGGWGVHTQLVVWIWMGLEDSIHRILWEIL